MLRNARNWMLRASAAGSQCPSGLPFDNGHGNGQSRFIVYFRIRTCICSKPPKDLHNFANDIENKHQVVWSFCFAITNFKVEGDKTDIGSPFHSENADATSLGGWVVYRKWNRKPLEATLLSWRFVFVSAKVLKHSFLSTPKSIKIPHELIDSKIVAQLQHRVGLHHFTCPCTVPPWDHGGNETVPALSRLSRCVPEIIHKGPEWPRRISLQLQSLERCTSTCEIASEKVHLSVPRLGVMQVWGMGLSSIGHWSLSYHFLLQDYHDLLSKASTAQGQLRRGDSTAWRGAEGPLLGWLMAFARIYCCDWILLVWVEGHGNLRRWKVSVGTRQP